MGKIAGDDGRGKKRRVLEERGTATGIAFPVDCCGECERRLKWIKNFQSKVHCRWSEYSKNSASTKLQGVSKNRWDSLTAFLKNWIDGQGLSSGW